MASLVVKVLSAARVSILFVIEVRTDRRSRHIETDADEVRELDVVADAYLERKRELAKRLARFEAGGGHLALAYGSVRDYARQRLGIPGVEIAPLLDLGRALLVKATHLVVDGSSEDGPSASGEPSVPRLPAVPLVEQRVVERAMSTENATTLGRLLRQVPDIDADERAQWTRRAETQSAWKLRRLVRERIEEAAQGEVTVPIALQVTERARDDFRRARELASRRAGQWLTEGQTFALVVRRFVHAEDQRFVGEKRRRVAGTAGPVEGRPRTRYVPAAVKRAVRERADDCCEVPGCSSATFLELMHVGVAHRDGGSREADNLALGCSTHHFLLDAGVIRFAGWRDGRPVFRDRCGRELDGERRRPAVGSTASRLGAPVGDAATSGNGAGPTSLERLRAVAATEPRPESRDLPRGRSFAAASGPYASVDSFAPADSDPQTTVEASRSSGGVAGSSYSAQSAAGDGRIAEPAPRWSSSCLSNSPYRRRVRIGGRATPAGADVTPAVAGPVPDH